MTVTQTLSPLEALLLRAGASDTDRDARWEPIPGWESLYEVSDLGQVRSLRAGRLLAGSRHPGGYSQVRLQAEGRVEWVRVHRLVALVFIGPPTGPYVRHLDGDSKNNRVGNLAYGTPSENSHDTVRTGHYRNATSHATECANGHPFTEENTYVPKGTTWRRCRECRRDWEAKRRGSRS